MHPFINTFEERSLPMVPMIELQQTHQAISDFYDGLAPEYDAMTSFEKRFVRDKPFFRMLIERYKIGTAIDAGCGTGFHSMMLAQLGVKVTAVDLSAVMLERVGEHARDLGMDLTLVQAGFDELATTIHQPVDAVFCLGNSLPHLLTVNDLSRALENFASVLKPSGLLFMQQLNYDRILHDRERIQSIKESGTKVYIRYYDYDGDHVSFNIIVLDKQRGAADQTLKSILLRPIRKDSLFSLLTTAGFSGIEAHGSIAMDAFSPEDSTDLVTIARSSDSRAKAPTTIS